VSFKPIEAETDEDALLAARQFTNGCEVEVWHLDRKVGRIEHKKVRARSSASKAATQNEIRCAG
jgi:hypothetical protein